MAVETEVKLIPPDGFRMPALDGIVRRSTLVPLAVRELDARYFDTPSLDLARWGVTVRHRTGEPGPAWTLKLPSAVSGSLLARHELSFDGGPATIPSDLIDLVRAFAREPLGCVADLRTTRTPVQVHDRAGRPLIEIVDDSVVVDAETGASAFREIEVELLDDTVPGRKALRKVTSALVGAGCRREAPIPKLVRALGRPAQDPPPIVVEALDRRASIADLIRHLVAASATQIVQQDPAVRIGRDPEAVHQFRVGARRLRSELRTFAGYLDPGPTGHLSQELSWLGQAAGRVRDLDVLGSRFRARASDLASVDQPAATELLEHLTHLRLEAWQDLTRALRSTRYDRLVESLVDFASDPPYTTEGAVEARGRASAVAGALVRRPWKKLRAAARSVGDDPTDDDLHRIRIAAKRCRYAAEAVAPVVGHRADRFAAGIEAIQTVLGDHHDTVVAEAWLRDAADHMVDQRLAIGGLVAADRRQRLELRADWPATWHAAARPEARAWLKRRGG